MFIWIGDFLCNLNLVTSLVVTGDTVTITFVSKDQPTVLKGGEAVAFVQALLTKVYRQNSY